MSDVAEIARTIDTYDGRLVVSVTAEAGETRIGLVQNGKPISFTEADLQRIAQQVADFNQMMNREPRVAVARAAGQGA